MSAVRCHVATPIGETRVAVLQDGRIRRMMLAREGDGLRAGAVVLAHLRKKLGRRGIATVAGGEEIVVEPWPDKATEGASVAVAIHRAAWREEGRDRLAKARPTTKPPCLAPDLVGEARKEGPTPDFSWPDFVAEAWDEAFAMAEIGHFPFPGGSLHLSPTPAFLAVDIDGADLAPPAPGADLAGRAAVALAAALVLFDVGGMVVVDWPVAGREARRLAGEAFDRAMAGAPFERTAVNGFGLMTIVRPRHGPSILERARYDRAGTEALALLHAAVAARDVGPLHLRGSAPAGRWLRARPQLLRELEARTRREVILG